MSFNPHRLHGKITNYKCIDPKSCCFFKWCAAQKLFVYHLLLSYLTGNLSPFNILHGPNGDDYISDISRSIQISAKVT